MSGDVKLQLLPSVMLNHKLYKVNCHSFDAMTVSISANQQSFD